MLLLRNLLITYPGMILSTIIFGVASVFVSPFASTGRTQHALARLWAQSLCWICGVKVRVEGLENLPPAGSFVLAANHRSYMDSPIILPNINLQFRFFAKSSVFYWPLIGYHLKKSGHLPVHYDNPRKSLQSMSAAADAIQERGISMLLFPEAGRTLGELEPFKDGAAYIAIKAGVPVVPIGLIGTLAVQPPGALFDQPGEYNAACGKADRDDRSLACRSDTANPTFVVKVAELIGHPIPEDMARSLDEPAYTNTPYIM